MTEFKSDGSARQIVKNAFFTAFRFCVFFFSGLILIPFLLGHYGKEGYGLIALAGFLTQYVGMISGCVGTAVARYLNIALNRNDWKEANEIFTTALLGNLWVIAIQVPLFVLGVWKLEYLIDFSPEVALDFKILVVFNIAIFFLNIIKGVFFIPIYAANRLDISESFDLASQIARLVLLLSLVSLLGARLWVIGAVDFGLSLVVFFLGLGMHKKMVKRMLLVRREYFSKKWFKPILSMAGWSLVSALGFSLFIKTDVWIINRFVSKEMAGVYAALLIWPSVIKRIGGVVGGIVAPVLTIDYAKENHARMENICIMSCLLVSYLAALICGLVVVAAPDLIRFWIGEDFVQYSIWVRLLVGQLVFTISGSILWRIFVTIGETKYMGIGNLVPGLLNIGISLVLVFMGFGTTGVLIGSLVAMGIKENLLFPIWISKEAKIPLLLFYSIYARAGLAFGGVVLTAYGLLYFNSEFSFVRLVLAAVASGLVLLAVMLLLSSRNERQHVVRFISNGFRP